MDRLSQEGSPWPLAGLLVLVAVAIGLLQDTSSLSNVSRPQTPEFRRKGSDEMEPLSARLWQDPLRVVRQAEDREEEPLKRKADDSTDELRRWFRDRFAVAKAESSGGDPAEGASGERLSDLLVLPVLIPGAAYPSDVEVRRRTRYAVVAALATRGFVAVKPGALGVYEWLYPGDTKDRNIPFEWYERDSLRRTDANPQPQSVLVLWVDESALGSDKPIQRLHALLSSVLPFGEALVRIKTCALGPSSSEILLAMLQEIAAGPGAVLEGDSERGSAGGPESAANRIGLDANQRSFVVSSVLGEMERYLDMGTSWDSGSAFEVPMIAQDPEPWAGNEFVQGIVRNLQGVQVTVDPGDKRETLEGDLDAALFQDRQDQTFLVSSPPRAVARALAVSDATRWIQDSDPEWRNAVADRWWHRYGWSIEGFVGPSPTNVSDSDPVVAPPEASSNPTPWLKLLSWRATAAPDLLVEALEAKGFQPESKTSVESLFEEWGITFRQVAPTDDELVDSLIAELSERRGLHLTRPTGRQHVVLIGEWDSFYSRALPLTFEKRLQQEIAKRAKIEYSDDYLPDVISPPGRVHRFSYLRGLAGTDLGGAASDGDASEAENPEASFGDSQLDGMRRLSVALSLLQRDIAQREGGRIGAIGVLGSDFEDKLIILAALRTRFPDAHFFTTDLDARLLDADEFGSNRNVIVASGFGLELTHSLQDQAPPFRDGYQTSAYLSTLLAFGPVRIPTAGGLGGAGFDRRDALVATGEDRPDEKADQAEWIPLDDIDEALNPRIFEIGRSGAYDLTPDAAESAPHAKQQRHFPHGWFVFQASLGALVLALILICNMHPVRELVLGKGERRNRGENGRLTRQTGLIQVGCLIALFAIIWWQADGGAGEPFELFEGISVWPTEILRLVALGLAYRFAVFARRSMDDLTPEVHEEYGLAIPVWADRKKKESVSRQVVKPAPRQFFASFLRHRMLTLMLWKRAVGKKYGDGQREGVCRYGYRQVLSAIAAFRRASLSGWADEEARNELRGKAIDAQTEWDRYIQLGTRHNRLARSLPPTILFLLLGVVLFWIYGWPLSPARGSVAIWVDRILFGLILLSVSLLVFWAVDAFRLCSGFVLRLSLGPSEYPPGTRRATITTSRGLDPSAMQELIDMKIIGRLTDRVGRLILYPFAVLTLLILARNSYFDNWTWPIPVLFLYGVLVVHAVASAVALRRAAERARARSVQRLNRSLMMALSQGSGSKGDAPTPAVAGRAKARKSVVTKRSRPDASDPGGAADATQPKVLNVAQVQAILAEIQSMNRGAFSRIRDNPIVQALVMPFGGAGIVTLLDNIASMG